MNKNLYYIFTAISFSLLIAAPGRFAFGLVLCFEVVFLLLFGFLFSFLLKLLDMENLNPLVTVLSLTFSTVLYKQIITLLFPLVALQLSFVFYLPAVTSYIIGIVYNKENRDLKNSIIDNSKIVGLFSVFALIFYLIRDIFGYGTFTLPTRNGLLEKVIFDTNSFSWSIIFASVPGAIFMISLSIVIFIYVQSKFKIVERVIQKDGDLYDAQ